MDQSKLVNLFPVSARAAAFLGAASLAFAVSLIVIPDFGVLHRIIGFVCLLSGILLMICALNHDNWTYGIEVEDEGFRFKAPMRKALFIPFSTITRIRTTAIRDEFGDPEDTFRVRSSLGRTVVLPGHTGHREFIERIKRLPGFNAEAWEERHVVEDALTFDGLMPRRTTIFEKRQEA